MRLGIDFGTTRTIVAHVDRGNYPVVAFEDADGDLHEYFPSVAARATDGTLRFGFDALALAATDGVPLTRSFKRVLGDPTVTWSTPVDVGGREVAVGELMTGFLGALHEAIRHASSLREHADDAIEAAVVGVPAHAHGPQRFITLDASRRAGFPVTAMINEPSAAAFEYSHHRPGSITARRTRVLVYDLGGGTFDASLVDADGRAHEILDSLGLNALGGDDFDATLALVAAETAGTTPEALSPRAYAALLEECRDAKERLTPQSKRIVLEVGGEPTIVPVEAFYDAAGPLVEATVSAMAPLVDGLERGVPDLTTITGIYLVGGASGLPLVPRRLREHFGRRVHRSPSPAASTAMGLAIAADESSGYQLTDRLSRDFGVFREAKDGTELDFDAILTRDQRTSTTGSVTVTRRYRAVHNIGRYRFVEHTVTTPGAGPRGHIVPFAEVVFPFDPALQDRDEAELAEIPVERIGHGPKVEETYTVDEHGIVTVRLADLTTGHAVVRSLAD